jgi:hypothetical protein
MAAGARRRRRRSTRRVPHIDTARTTTRMVDIRISATPTIIIRIHIRTWTA